MDASVVALLAAGMLVAAFLYASVGHGGASAYIAAMAIAGVAPVEMRPIALQLNVLVSAIAAVKFYRAGYFRWSLFWPFAVTSIPAAYLGGAITLPGTAYKILVGAVLLYAAWQLWWSARAGAELRPMRDVPLALAMVIGGALGVLSGLTGVGGGIFLSPMLLLLGWAGTKQTSAAGQFVVRARRRIRRKSRDAARLRMAADGRRGCRRLDRRGVRQPAILQPGHSPRACIRACDRRRENGSGIDTA